MPKKLTRRRMDQTGHRDEHSNLLMHNGAIVRQDEILVKINSDLTRLDALAKEMGAEISTQGKIIDKVDRDVDTAQAKTTTVLGRVDKLLNSVSKERQCMIIGVLVVILVICIVIAFVI